MIDASKTDKLDASIGDVIARGESASTGDEDVDALGRLAVGLRGLARPEFRTRLRAELLPKQARRLPRPGWSNGISVSSWFRGQGPFLVSGSSFGLGAGACCVTGFAANVLGIASAETARVYIENSLPFLVALSLAGLIGWIVWLLREQGVTVSSVSRLIRQHGLALGGSYGAVFGASMALAMARGIY